MKRWIALLAALVMTLLCAVSLAEEAVVNSEALQLFSSEWADGFTDVRIYAEEDHWRVRITGAGGSTEWDYCCRYDEAQKMLTTLDTDNVKTEIRIDEEGSEIERKDVYNDGKASFFLNEEGKLIWDDEKEDAGAGFAFEKIGWFAYDFYSEHYTMNVFWDVDEEEDGTIHAGLKVQIEQDDEQSYTSWTYSAAYNAEDNTLVAFLGTKEVQEAAGEALATIYYDGEAVFSWDEEGGLHWDDKVEGAGEGETFMRSNG